jgi:hypothetical protein
MQYTWSHNIDSFGHERGDSALDMRHVMNAAALYELPFGRGHKTNFDGSKVLDAAFGGWSVGGNLNFRTGLPINILMQRNNAPYLNPQTGVYTTSPLLAGGKPVTVAVINIPGGGQSRGTRRPDLVQGVNPYADSGSGFCLNPAAFSVPLPGTYDNFSRGALRGPQLFQFDNTLTKQFHLGERAARRGLPSQRPTRRHRSD